MSVGVFTVKVLSRAVAGQNLVLPAAADAGVKNVIVDVGVLDIPSVSWAAQTIREIKDHMGYPCGCASANALYTCEFLKESGPPVFEAGAAAVVSRGRSTIDV